MLSGHAAAPHPRSMKRESIIAHPSLEEVELPWRAKPAAESDPDAVAYPELLRRSPTRVDDRQHAEQIAQP